jgi:hypothetical protein
MMEPILNKYKDLYSKYYWPIEEDLAKWYQADIAAARPYDERMRDYQLGRGDELIDLAGKTNNTLDRNKIGLVNELTKDAGELTDRYRSQASTDVAAAFGNQVAQDRRALGLYGINPNSGAFRNMLSNSGNMQAMSQASARTQAARQAEDVALNRNMQALSLYTNPTRQYDPGTLTPGISVSGLLNAGQAQAQNSMYNTAAEQKQSDNMWGGIMGGVNMLGQGVAGLSGGSFKW